MRCRASFMAAASLSKSTSQVSIPPEVLAQYQNVNSIANQVAQTPFQQYSTDPNAFVAPLTTTQQAGVLGTNQYASEGQPFFQTASNETQAVANQAGTAGGLDASVQSYMNPYEASVINPTNQLLQQQYNQAQSGQLGNAVQNGAFGGDRAALTAANLQQQQSLAMGQTDANLLNQNYSQALGTAQQQQGTALGAANQEANIGSGAQSAGLAGAQAQLTAGQAQQQTEQAGLTALYNQFLQQQSYPFQTTQFLGNIAEGTGALSGSTTTSNQPAPYFSDERLKEDIQPIGELYDGQKVIKFRYKGGKQTHVGLSAQDVEKKHPHAVGLAGGFKTVDYDEATKDAASRGMSHQGGLVIPFRRHDGSLVPERRHFDTGGYAGLSPNSAWNAGFVLDPSYLQSQEQSYGLAPWGNAGPATGSAPYGGKSHVPPSMEESMRRSRVAKPPSQSNGSGIQQLSQGFGQLEKLGGQGKSLFNTAKGGVGNFFGGSPQPSATTGGTTAPGNTPPAPHEAPPTTTPSPGAPAPADPMPTQMGPEHASLDTGDQFADASGLAGGAPDMSGLGDDLSSLFASRGGLIHRDSGGSVPSFSQPTDSGQDDQSDSGDIPYDSGTGSSGLDIPDDKSNNKLAVAQPPQQQSGGGGFNPMSILTGALGLFGLASGGRVGLAGGGDPSDVPDDAQTAGDPLQLAGAQPAQAVGDHLKYYNSGDAVPSSGIDTSWMSEPYGGHSTNYGPPKGSVGSPGLAPPAPPAAPDRDITVHARKAAPTAAPDAPPSPSRSQDAPAAVQKAGLSPDVPAPDAQPVQATAPQGQQGHVTEPGEVLNQSNLGGVGDFLNSNQGLIVPFLHGLGTMASSNSRYLGSAILQGLGGAADSYENVQNEMQQRHGLQPVITQKQNDALQSDLSAWQSYTAQTGANLSFSDFEKLKSSGQLQSYKGGSGAPGAPGGAGGSSGGPGDANGPYSFTPQERMTRRLANGNMAYQDPAYNAGYSAKNSGIGQSVPFVQGTVNDADRAGAEAIHSGFTTNAQGQRVPVPGYGSTALTQSQPEVQAAQAKSFQDQGVSFAKEYGRNMSLFDELGDVFKNFQAGPTADWRASAARLANEFDPQGNYPFLHNIPAGDNAANYDKARKDIAQITAATLNTLPGGAPATETALLGHYAADPTLSPDALRDIVIRGKANLQQAYDYYRGFDPFSNGANGVPNYTMKFYHDNPFDKYRQQFDKATPAFSGGKEGAGGAGQGAAQSQSAPQNGGLPVYNSPDDVRKAKLPPNTPFMTRDGRRLLSP